MRKNIHALTENHLDYPAFASLNQEGTGEITLTVRSRGDGGKNVGTIALSSEQLKALVKDATAFLDQTENAAQAEAEAAYREFEVGVPWQQFK